MEYAPDIEDYSIDESFLFFDKCNWSIKDYEEIGHDLKRRIAKEVGIPICVGAAPTKTLAKLYNKKDKEHNGVFVYNPREVDALLESVDCGSIWGIDPARAQKLLLHGIKNALMLKHMPLCDAKRLLTIQGFATVQELNGIRSVEKVTREKKEVITSSRQFSVKVESIEILECALVQYTEIAVERLRQQNCECQAVQVTISTCNYYSDAINSQYSNGVIVQLPRLTSYTPDIVNAARMALPHIFRKRLRIQSNNGNSLRHHARPIPGLALNKSKRRHQKKTPNGCRGPDYKLLRTRIHHPRKILVLRRLADEEGIFEPECYDGY